jgi:hypothetical protein
MISNEQVVERVMRMGIESRCGVPDDRLHDLARKQLTEEAKRGIPQQPTTFEEWLNLKQGVFPWLYAFSYIKGVLQVIKVMPHDKLKLIEWRSNNWPVVEVLHA